MTWVYELLGWLTGGLVLVSFIEYGAHRWLMHRDGLDAFRFAHHLHHDKYYRTFNQEDHPVGKYLNLKITWGDLFLAWLLVSPLAYWSPLGYGVLWTYGLLHRWCWNLVHSEMHLNQGTWFSQTRLYQWLCFRHFLHHRHQNRNYNVLLPLGDWVLRTSAKPTEHDRELWEQLAFSQGSRPRESLLDTFVRRHL